MGLSAGRGFKFVKKYANLYEVMLNATQEYVRDVKSEAFQKANTAFNPLAYLYLIVFNPSYSLG